MVYEGHKFAAVYLILAPVLGSAGDMQERVYMKFNSTLSFLTFSEYIDKGILCCTLSHTFPGEMQ